MFIIAFQWWLTSTQIQIHILQGTRMMGKSSRKAWFVESVSCAAVRHPPPLPCTSAHRNQAIDGYLYHWLMSSIVMHWNSCCHRMCQHEVPFPVGCRRWSHGARSTRLLPLDTHWQNSHPNWPGHRAGQGVLRQIPSRCNKKTGSSIVPYHE